MPAGRHRKTTPWTQRLRRASAPAALALAVATALPVAATTQATPEKPVTDAAFRPAPEAARADIRTISRSLDRETPQRDVPLPIVRSTAPPLELKPRWTTTRLNVWNRPGKGAKLLKVLNRAVKVQVTGAVRGPWVEIQQRDRMVWVRKSYLARTQRKAKVLASAARNSGAPASSASSANEAGVSGAPCADGSAIESGLQANTIKVYRAVCAAFPAVSSWGGRSGSGDHGAGRALDIMVSGSSGHVIAEYVRANASAFGVSEVIFAQRIWTPLRGAEGWRSMSDRGSSTANHYDHVHVSVH